MAKQTFTELLEARWNKEKFLCPGLDPAYDLIPDWFKKQQDFDVSQVMSEYNKAIIDSTASEVCAYKPNSALYEAQGSAGWIALEKTTKYLNEKYPEIPIIYDGKRNEIGRTNDYYAQAAFDVLNVDAITLNPWAGLGALESYTSRAGKGVFILCRMTNPGSECYQEVTDHKTKTLLYELVAKDAAELAKSSPSTIGLVVGSQHPNVLKRIREVVGAMPLLIPGIGAQGGSIKESVQASIVDGAGIILSTGRAIMFPSAKKDFADTARSRCKEFNTEIVNAFKT